MPILAIPKKELSTNMLSFGGFDFSSVSRDALVEEVTNDHGDGGTKIVITPNIQHLDVLNSNPDAEKVLNSADFIVPDGWPVALALRLIYGDKRGRIAGSDLAMDVLSRAEDKELSVGFVGGSDKTLSLAYENLRVLYPRLTLIRPSSNPVLPQTPTSASISEVGKIFEDRKPDILFFCFGAPKSELHAIQGREQMAGIKAILCVGATVDFIAGTKHRAPRIVQCLRLEWFFRLLQEPRRLLPRYIRGVRALSMALAESTWFRYFDR